MEPDELPRGRPITENHENSIQKVADINANTDIAMMRGNPPIDLASTSKPNGCAQTFWTP
jgi:hypothetical protein